MLAAGKFEANALGIPGGAVLTGNLPLKDDGIPDEALSTGKFAHQKTLSHSTAQAKAFAEQLRIFMLKAILR